MKALKTKTGKIASSVGFNSNGGATIRRDSKAIIIEQKRNGWIFISYSNNLERYLYYSKREAIKKFREKYNLKGRHLQIINL